MKVRHYYKCVNVKKSETCHKKPVKKQWLEDLEIRIANEKLTKPRVNHEFVTFWLHCFRKLDVRQQVHRKMLIDTFINAIYLFDDKIVITFNYKDGTKTI